jgi:hypothetical protein
MAEPQGAPRESCRSLCSLPSALRPQPSALSPQPSTSGFVPSSKVRCSAWKVVAVVRRSQGQVCNRARSELCVVVCETLRGSGAALPSRTLPCPLCRDRSQRWQTTIVAACCCCCGPQSVVDRWTAAKLDIRAGRQVLEF